MPITVELDEATLTTTLKISPEPDEQVEDKDVWQMDEQALHEHPEFSQNLRDAGFQYLGVIRRSGKKKSDAETRTLLYARYEEEKDAVHVEETGAGDEREGWPRRDPKGDGSGVQQDDELPEPASPVEAEAPAPKEEVTTPEPPPPPPPEEPVEKTPSARRK